MRMSAVAGIGAKCAHRAVRALGVWCLGGMLATVAHAARCDGSLVDLPTAAVAASDASQPSITESKFRLASVACPEVLQPSPDPAHRPRLAAQMSLYDLPHDESEPFVVLPRVRSHNAVVAKAAAPSRAMPPSSSSPSSATVQRIRAMVPALAKAAQAHNIDPLLLHAVAHVESRHNAQANSHAGAKGLMQVMPATARRFGMGDPHRELLVPELNAQVSAEYLKVLQRRFGNNLPLVLAAYNAGEGAVEKYGRRIPPYPETQAYVRNVLAVYALLKQRVGPAPGVKGSA